MRKYLVILIMMILIGASLSGCSRKSPVDQPTPSTQVTVVVGNLPDKAFVLGSAPSSVANLEIKPATKFIAGSTIEVSLKSGKWNQTRPTAEQNKGWTYEGLFNNDLSVRYTQAGEVGLETLTLVLPGVIIAPDTAVGDLIVTVGGTAGVTGDYTVGKIVTGVKVNADKPVVRVSALEQPAGKIAISEAVEHGFNSDAPDLVLKLTLPNGVNFSSNPEVYLDGKEIVNIRVDDGGRGQNYIQWKGQAITERFGPNRTEKIEISAIYYDIDSRFAPKDINVEVSGQVLTGVGGSTATIAAVVNASARSLNSGISTFVVGRRTANIAGKSITMDVAPYKSENRIFVPLRYAANALAISDGGIIWDQVNQTVTLTKGNSVVQVKVGSTTMLLNGVAVTMDVSPQLVGQRVMLPVSWVAQAFGGAVIWDEATQTATLAY